MQTEPSVNESDRARIEYVIAVLEKVQKLGRDQPLGDLWSEVVTSKGALKKVLQPNIVS